MTFPRRSGMRRHGVRTMADATRESSAK